MEYEQPKITIEGTDFFVDVMNCLLQESSNPHNKIFFDQMKDTDEGYEFDYCLKAKNIDFSIFEKSVLVRLPQMIRLDPEGMARKFNLSMDELKGKTDFDLMVDQAAYRKRIVMGILPTIDIAGNLFYVDLSRDMLRPTCNDGSQGVTFSGIQRCFELERMAYLLPFNLKTHEFQAPDYNSITEFPKDIVAVEIPVERELDRVGWNIKYGYKMNEDLKWLGLKSHHTAAVIPWKDTFLAPIVEANLRRQQREKPKEVPPSLKPRRKGRGM